MATEVFGGTVGAAAGQCDLYSSCVKGGENGKK